MIDLSVIAGKVAWIIHRQDFEKWNRRKEIFFKWYFRLYHRLEIRGRENIPDGPAVIIPNHAGGYDLDLLALTFFSLPGRKVTPLIIHSWHYAHHWWGRWYVGAGLPLYPGRNMQYDYFDDYLKPGGENYPGLMVLFPEGNIKGFSERHHLGKFYPGALRLALKYQVPLIPAAMVGFAEASPVVKVIEHENRPDDLVIFPFTLPKKLVVEFGEPVSLESHYDFSYSKEEEFKIINTEVRPRLASLLEKYYPVTCDPF